MAFIDTKYHYFIHRGNKKIFTSEIYVDKTNVTILSSFVSYKMAIKEKTKLSQ